MLEETPPELTADIGNAGIIADRRRRGKLRGLVAYLEADEKMRVRIAEEPEDCVILGAGRAVQWIDGVEDGRGQGKR